MKGVIFTSFVEMMEKDFGMEFSDRILTETELASGGAFTAVGNYSHQELIAMVLKISEITGKPVKDLMGHFGEHMLHYFLENYPVFFEGIDNSFDLLKTVDGVIHVEVKKLYPDAQLPQFNYEVTGKDEMEFIYYSPRKMSDFANGLIKAIIRHYGEKIGVDQELVDQNGSRVKFLLRKVN